VRNKFYDVTKRKQLIKMYTAICRMTSDIKYLHFGKALWPTDVCLFDEMRTWYTYGGRNAMIWLFS
jgi:hypothetical protein